MEQVAWTHVLIAGWPVLSILLVGSIITVAVTLERWRVYAKVQVDSGPFLESIGKSIHDREKIIRWCDQSDQPLAKITAAILKGPAVREDRERLMQRCIQTLVSRMERHISLLGTIASVAPFVGLLGTVIGIIRSFRAVSMTSSGGASLVALGIAEALVGTAAGLVVAIPALLAYNYFVNRLRRFTQDWEVAGGEILDMSLHQRGQQ